MKRIIGLIFFIILLVVILSICNKAKLVYEPIAIAAKINDRYYSGKTIIRDIKSGTIYFPISDCAKLLNLEYEENKDGFTLGKIEECVDDNNVIKYNGCFYVSETALVSQLGLNVYHNDVWYIDNYPKLDYSWTKYRIVGHAFGAIDEYSYTNSKDALLENYSKGFRLFEVDFDLTSDGVPICAHDWRWTYTIMNLQLPSGEEIEPEPLDAKEFKSHKIYGKYEPMTYEDLVKLMIEYPDFYVITDTKDVRNPEVEQMFSAFVDIAKQYDINVLDRIIPQVYNNEMYDIISEIYDWKSVVYTFYNQGSEFRYWNVYKYAREHGIKAFATYDSRNDLMFINTAVAEGCWIYMYTYNSMDDVYPILKNLRVWGVYTDFLPYDSLDNTSYPYITTE